MNTFANMSATEYTEKEATRLIRSFGRVKNRQISPSGQQRLQTFLNNYSITADADITPLLSNYTALNLEIGFGFGEHLYQLAQQTPQELFIGCETYLNGIANLALLVETQAAPNLRIINDDARKFMLTLPGQSIQRLFLLFPDPWPKNSQRKRRILNSQFMQLVNKLLTINGQFIVASDHPDYMQQLLKLIATFPNLQPDLRSQQTPFQEPENWISTRYQQKSLAGSPQFFIFNKVSIL